MSFKRIGALLGILPGLLLAWSGVVAAADVREARVWRAPDHTRVVLELSGPVEHRVISLQNPDRLVVDISGARMRADLSGLDLGSSPIERVRHAARNQGDLRVVFDLSEAVDPRSFLLRPSGEHGNRLVIDLHDRKQRSASVRHVDMSQRRDVVIAIDPGHGGEDPGAIGPGGVQEKRVVLAIARELAALIDREPGYRAVLIRDGDYFVSLQQRRQLARKAQADLMVSVHADAFTTPQARGASVYALSWRGASSTMAGFLAASENSADAIGGVPIEGKDNELVKVLADLSMSASLDASLKVGDHILQSMGGIAHLHSRRVEQAGFAVLRSPDIPSILVETGFISNPEEARRLATSAYQQQMARAIFDGINGYFSQRPPPDTYLAWVKRNGRPGSTEYVIARGDTLSSIAHRHRVTVSALREHNGLADNRIRAGQTLIIP